MRGDRLSRQWWSVQAIEASPNGLTGAEIAKREEKISVKHEQRVDEFPFRMA